MHLSAPLRQRACVCATLWTALTCTRSELNRGIGLSRAAAGEEQLQRRTDKRRQRDVITGTRAAPRDGRGTGAGQERVRSWTSAGQELDKSGTRARQERDRSWTGAGQELDERTRWTLVDPCVSTMPPVSRTLLFALVTLLVVLLVVDDISQVERDTASSRQAQRTPKPHRQAVVRTDPTTGPPLLTHPTSTDGHSQYRQTGNWTFNHTLANLIRKDILHFLDPVRDMSILRGAVSPGDTVHYVLDRHSSTHISDTLYRLLPSAPPLRRQYHQSCAIVGNSGILLNSRCGHQIDQHPFVIRCNLAPVEEFSMDVGFRTDLVTMNPSVVQRAFGDLLTEEWRQSFAHRLKALGGSVLWVPAFMAKGGEDRVEWALKLIGEQGLEVRTAVPSLRLLHAVRGYWLTKRVPIKRPSTGLLMYTMATRFCSQLHLYGFWPFPQDPHGAPVKYHYYDQLTYQYTSSSSPHAMPLEYRTLSSLHSQGALRLHTGPCEPPQQTPGPH